MAWVDEQDLDLLRQKEYMFWRSISLVSDLEEDCWLWHKSTTPNGYGKIHLGSNRAGKQIMIYAHRFSYLLFNGSIPQNMLCLHKCDEPRCSNPLHLFIGNKADNSIDMMQKGRGNGQFHPEHTTWVGKHHTEETKRKISEAKRKENGT